MLKVHVRGPLCLCRSFIFMGPSMCMVIVWRLRGNIIRTAPCGVVWHNVHSQQHTHVSSSYSSYRSSRLTSFLQCFDTVGLVIWPVKIVPDMTYNVFGGTLNLAQFLRAWGPCYPFTFINRLSLPDGALSPPWGFPFWVFWGWSASALTECFCTQAPYMPWLYCPSVRLSHPATLSTRPLDTSSLLSTSIAFQFIFLVARILTRFI